MQSILMILNLFNRLHQLLSQAILSGQKCEKNDANRKHLKYDHFSDPRLVSPFSKSFLVQNV